MTELANSNTPLPDGLIRSLLAPFDFRPSATLAGAIRGYVQILRLWNKRISLTSLGDTRSIVERHFGESLFAVHAVPIEEGRLADVGSGAGFPGLPIKMASPRVDLILIESNSRKAAFLSEAVRRLGLSGASVANKRMQEVNFLEDSLDFVVARALGDTPRLLNWSRLSLRAGGKVVLWLGTRDSAEVLSLPGWVWRPPILIPRSERRVLVVGGKSR